jgi:HK97 family phage portal protein
MSRTWVPSIQAGMHVNHDTALQFSAVFRAIDYISSQLAMVPWCVYRDDGNKKIKIETHPAYRLLYSQPNPEMTAFTFKQTLLAHALSWGNGYAEIIRDRGGRPAELWPISPDRVEVTRDPDTQKVVYEISNARDGKTLLAQEQMFHLHGMGFDGLVGYSVVSMASRAIGLGMAADQFGASFFQNGTATSGVLEHPGKIGEEAIKNLRDSWNDQYRGPGKAHKPVILEEGMQWKPISIPPDDAQFLETRKFQVDEIARWYGLPPHKLQSMEHATFSNIEHQSIEVVKDALAPWAIRMEQEANRRLFASRSTPFYSKMNLNALMRGDTAARGEWYTKMWNLGVFSINEIRELEDMNPVTDGDKRFVQLNMTTLEKAGEEPEPAPVLPEEEEEETQEIEEVAAKIVRREMFRLHDAAKRYEGDRDGFISWMFEFFAQHEQYAIKQFLDLSVEATEVVQKRVPDARLRMLTFFDEGVEYPVKDSIAELLQNVQRGAA